MKLIQPSFSIINQEPGLDGIYKAIESAGRTCYKSEDKITPTSAKEFVGRMIKSGHGAMLEFGTVYLKIPVTTSYSGFSEIHYLDNSYSKMCKSDGFPFTDEFGNACDCWCITTNYRNIIENGWLDDLQYLCEPTEFHEKRICVRFNCSIGISRELNRHRVDSIAEMSTRYCNFSKDKFGNELTFVIPSHLNEEELKKYGPYHTVVRNKKSAESIFIANLNNAEKDYLDLIDSGWKAQQARDILPLATATEVNHCAFVSDWEHVFELRDNSHAHPDMQVLMKPLHEEFKKKFKIK